MKEGGKLEKWKPDAGIKSILMKIGQANGISGLKEDHKVFKALAEAYFAGMMG
jgi:hypothetical protein